MQECTFEYSIIRVVPRVEREEFMNVGVLVSCPFQDFLEARVELSRKRLAAFDPHADFDEIDQYLRVIPRICAGGDMAGPIGQLPQRARFHWLVAPRSTIIQFSPVHSGLCHTPADAIEALFLKMVALPDFSPTK
jgi:hypothetical protein